LTPIDLIWTGIALALVAALGAVTYSAYHRWQIRDPFTADGFYHKERMQLGGITFMMATVFLFVLLMLLGVSR
jgi:hypothetical protein